MSVSMTIISLIGPQDSAIVYDWPGPVDGMEFIEKKTGDTEPETEESSGNFIFVEVITDGKAGNRQFQLKWGMNYQIVFNRTLSRSFQWRGQVAFVYLN